MPALSKARPPPQEASAFFADGCGPKRGIRKPFDQIYRFWVLFSPSSGYPCLVYARRLGSGSTRCLEDSRAYPMPDVISQVAVDWRVRL